MLIRAKYEKDTRAKTSTKQNVQYFHFQILLKLSNSRIPEKLMLEILPSSKRIREKSFFFLLRKGSLIQYIFLRPLGRKLRRSGTFNERTLESKVSLLQNVCKTKFPQVFLISCVNQIIFNMWQLEKNKTIQSHQFIAIRYCLEL